MSSKKIPKRKTARNKLPRNKLTGAQLECLSSLVRVDLYESIQRRGGASIVELAKELKKSPHSLYYHVRQLCAVKLIRVREYRRVGKRDEAIYEVVSKRLFIDKQNTSREYSEALSKTVRGALRKAEREHHTARLDGIDSSKFAVARVQVKLSTEDADSLRERITQLTQWVRERNIMNENMEGEEVSYTCLVVPIQ